MRHGNGEVMASGSKRWIAIALAALLGLWGGVPLAPTALAVEADTTAAPTAQQSSDAGSRVVVDGNGMPVMETTDAQLRAETEALLGRVEETINVSSAADLNSVIAKANSTGLTYIANVTADFTVGTGLTNMNQGEIALVGNDHTITVRTYPITNLLYLVSSTEAARPTLHLGLPDGSGGTLTLDIDKYGFELNGNAELSCNKGTTIQGASEVHFNYLIFSAGGVAFLPTVSLRGTVLHDGAAGVITRAPSSDFSAPGAPRTQVFVDGCIFDSTGKWAEATGRSGAVLLFGNDDFTMMNTIVRNCHCEQVTTGMTVTGAGVVSVGPGSHAVLRDVTFTGNQTNGRFSMNGVVRNSLYRDTINGGYIQSDLSPTIEIDHCTFQNNSSRGAGGMVVVAPEATATSSTSPGYEANAAGTNLTITNTVFANNTVQHVASTNPEWETACVVVEGVDNPVTIDNCEFDGNIGSRISAGVYLGDTPQFTVSGSTFTGNTSDAGAAMEVSGSTGSIEGCDFIENVATGDLGAPVSGGGALYVHKGAKVSMTGGKVAGNSSKYHGGGVWLAGGASLSMSKVEVSGNTTPTHGGGVSIPYKHSADEADTVLTMTGCTVKGNAAGEFGGGVQAMSGTVTLANCSIVNNVAGAEDPSAANEDLKHGSHGGGIWAESALGHLPDGADPDAWGESPAKISVTGGSVAGNRAGDHGGGAGASQGASLEMTGVSVTGNWAGDHGGGVLSQGGDSAGSPSEVTLVDCLVESNVAVNHGGGVGAAYESASANGSDDAAGPEGAAALADDVAGGTDAADGADADAPTAGRMTVTGGRVYGNETGGEGGGACAEAGAYLDLSKTKVYGNSAAVAADGVNVHDGATVLLGPAAAEAQLPCGHAVDGWYYDNAGARWHALVNQVPPVAYPLEAADGVAYDTATGVWTITAGDRSLKDAHGPEPHVPGAVTPPSTGGEVAPPAQEGNGGSAGEQDAEAGTVAPPDRLTAALPSTGDSLALWVGLFAAIVVLAAVVLAVALWRLRRQRRIQHLSHPTHPTHSSVSTGKR